MVDPVYIHLHSRNKPCPTQKPINHENLLPPSQPRRRFIPCFPPPAPPNRAGRARNPAISRFLPPLPATCNPGVAAARLRDPETTCLAPPAPCDTTCPPDHPVICALVILSFPRICPKLHQFHSNVPVIPHIPPKATKKEFLNSGGDDRKVGKFYGRYGLYGQYGPCGRA